MNSLWWRERATDIRPEILFSDSHRSADLAICEKLINDKTMNPSGYSGTPLAKKLGIKAGFTIRLENQPKYYWDLFSDFPPHVEIRKDRHSTKNFIHYFALDSASLTIDLANMRGEIFPDGILWISWPKKSSKVATDLTEYTIRNLALSNGLVDIKVCAVDEIWSGLKLVVPIKQRRPEA